MTLVQSESESTEIELKKIIESGESLLKRSLKEQKTIAKSRQADV
jgi:hypothetical protein